MKRIISQVMGWLMVAGCGLMPLALHGQDQTVSGNLTVTGTVDVQGDTMTLGTRTDTSGAGWLTLYTDGTISYVDHEASRGSNVWRWWQNGGATPQLQMTLDNNNTLVLYDQSSTPVAQITLNPLGTSTFQNSLTVNGTITLNGTDNEMPNQTLIGTNSVLTEGLADSRYLSSGGSSLAMFTGASATGTDAIALGDYTTASGANSFASGYASTASGGQSTAMGDSTAIGDNSTAIGQSTANGQSSTAMGYYSNASGYGSTAMGYYSNASGGQSTAMGSSSANGPYSTAMGYAAQANGDYSTAMGNSTTAQASYSVTVGAFNIGGGDTYNWVATDPLFEIGNGGDGNGNGNPTVGPADALIVYKNGNTTINGIDNEMPNQTLVGANSVLTEGLADNRYLAFGGTSLALFMGASATGTDAIALGDYTSASGGNSFAIGYGSTASGAVSTAMGNSTMAQSYGSVAMGQFNVGGFASGGDTNWIATDPLLELGNGTDSGDLSDALIVYKNGNTTINGIDNEMPNQTLVGTNSVLTAGLADGRYLSSGGTDNEIPNQTLVGANSVLTEGLADSRYLASGSSITFGGTDNEMPSQTLIGSTSVLTVGLADGRYLSSGGTDNEIPNQTLVGANSVLTEGLADSRYLLGGGTDNEMPNQTLTGTSSVLTEGLADGRYVINNNSGEGGTVLGSGTASGDESTTMGSSRASGQYSTAMGSSSASGQYSTAMGQSNALGPYSTAMGSYSNASGQYSTTIGVSVVAQAYADFVVGQCNVGGGNGGSWVATDPLFEIGNGLYNVAKGAKGSISYSDALVVYKNGSATFQGVVTVAPGGDIPMYAGY